MTRVSEVQSGGNVLKIARKYVEMLHEPEKLGKVSIKNIKSYGGTPNFHNFFRQFFKTFKEKCKNDQIGLIHPEN